MKRLHDARAVRIGLIADPHRLGLPYSVLLWASVVPRSRTVAHATIAELSLVSHVSTVSGRYNMMIVASAPDHVAMSDLAGTIRSKGVTEIVVRPIVRTLAHRMQLTRVR